MAQELNQFSQTADRGQIVLRGEGTNKMSVLVDATEAGVIIPGDLVVLVGSKGMLPTVKKATGGPGEVPLGFAVLNFVQNVWKANDLLEIALTSECMLMIAKEAITAGKKVAYDTASDKVQVAPSVAADATPEIGVALTSAAKDTDPVAVYIKTL